MPPQIKQCNDVGANQNAELVHTLIDNFQSKGSFVTDVNGNVLLDLCSTETLPLGHNSEAFIGSVTSNKAFDVNVINAGLDARDRAGSDFADNASDVLDSLAPRGLPNVTFTGAGNAVEQAIFAAMRERGADSRFTALGFEGCNHGTSLALVQFSAPSRSLQLGWPSVKYPESSGQEG